MSKLRRLRRLVPDDALFDRRVAGEPLRAIAPDYGVEHSTLSDFFSRSDGVVGLEEARRRLQIAREARQATERELQQDVRKRGQADAKHDRRLKAWEARHRPRRSGYLEWLDQRDAPRGQSSRYRVSANDEAAGAVVAAGGGIEQVVDATGLRTRENALRNVDPQVMRLALANDTRFPSNARPDDRGLRRLVPDSELIRRGAAKEPLRPIAADYGVHHTTILRYFNRSAVAKQMLHTRRRHDRPRGGGTQGVKSH